MEQVSPKEFIGLYIILDGRHILQIGEDIHANTDYHSSQSGISNFDRNKSPQSNIKRMQLGKP